MTQTIEQDIVFSKGGNDGEGLSWQLAKASSGDVVKFWAQGKLLNGEEVLARFAGGAVREGKVLMMPSTDGDFQTVLLTPEVDGDGELMAVVRGPDEKLKRTMSV
jgi:hypothetical protein